MRNEFHVGAVGKKVRIANMAPDPKLSPQEALELAAYLVATAIPLLPGDADTELQGFFGMLGDASESDDLSKAIRAERG